MKCIKNASKATLIFWILVAAVIFMFFYQIHPLILLDADDWLYSYSPRNMMPKVGYWNPARVLPEVLMPLVSYISAYLFYPISGDYIMSLALGYALTLTGFIVAYFYFAYRLLRQQAEITDFQALSVTAIFIILHFLVYRTSGSSNAYTFLAGNVTCIFYYIIPTLLNIILILYFECRRELFVQGRYLRNGGGTAPSLSGNLLQSVQFLPFTDLVRCPAVGEIDLREENRYTVPQG